MRNSAGTTVLAFDFGEKRIGVAVGDTGVGIAHPLTTVDAADKQRRFAAIAALIEEWRPAQLVVGLPSHLDDAPVPPVPPSDGAPASRKQGPAQRGAGARLRDATAEPAAGASVIPAPCASPGSDPKGNPLPPCDAPRLRDATVRESGASPSSAGAASVSGVTSPKGAPVPPSDGAEHEMARRARKFAAQLSGRFGLPVAFVDERLTSVAAELSLAAAGVAPRKRKARVDQVAAQEILQDYFDTAVRAALAANDA